MYLAAEQTQVAVLNSSAREHNRSWEWPTYVLLAVADLTAILLAAVASRQIGLLFSATNSQALRTAIVSQALFSIIALALFGMYPGIALHPVHELKRIFSAVALVSLIFTGAMVIGGRASSGIQVGLVAYGVLSAILVVLMRSLVRSVFGSRSWWGVPTVLIGIHQNGSNVLKILNRNRAIGLRVVAVLRAEETEESRIQLPNGILTGGLELAPFLASRKISRAIIALDSLSSKDVLPVIERYAGKYRHVHLMPNTGLMASMCVHAKDLGGLFSLEVNQVLLHALPQMFKRILDYSCALILSAVLSPLLLAIYAAVRISSPGPAMYGSRRIGLNGKIFTAWKFRSMVMDSDRVLQEHFTVHPEQRVLWDKHLKLKNDPRVTRVGRLLRRTSLDELPQLWNVLTGEMSLVGPRPILPHEMERYKGGLALYARVRPGVTGFWQVSGRNDTSFEERRMFDEYYVRNWSPWLDLYILGRTVTTVLRAHGSWV